MNHLQGDVAYGSGRSVSNLNLVEVLGKTSHLLERFGGHPMAVGIGLRAEHIAEFFEAMEFEIRLMVMEVTRFQRVMSIHGLMTCVKYLCGVLMTDFFSMLMVPCSGCCKTTTPSSILVIPIQNMATTS